MLTNVLPAMPLPMQQPVVDDRVLMTLPWAMLLQRVLAEAAQPTYVEGTHADRLQTVNGVSVNDASNFRPGTWWYETDRTVWYQARSVVTPPATDPAPVWIYAMGIMWGTVSPDQRPTDLGVHDAGFEFRGTDQAREFLWSQSEWVEVSNPAARCARSGATMTLTTTAQDVPNTSVTLDRLGFYWINAYFDFNLVGNDAGQQFTGYMNVAGSQLPPLALYTPSNAPGNNASRVTVGQQWIYQNTAVGTIAKLQASKSGGTGSSGTYDHCTILALWMSP